MLLWQVASIVGCVRSFVLVHWILVFLATPARTINKTRLNLDKLIFDSPDDLQVVTTGQEIIFLLLFYQQQKLRRTL